ncbi:hypothetical protein BaRGS_00017891, partial [Batillaria attramentaria]
KNLLFPTVIRRAIYAHEIESQQDEAKSHRAESRKSPGKTGAIGEFSRENVLVMVVVTSKTC